MSETQERFTVAELRYVSFICKCGLSIMHDIASGLLELQNPPRCPKCGESLEQLCRAVYTYGQFYNFAKETSVTLVSKKQD
jgi:hypothetical protein